MLKRLTAILSFGFLLPAISVLGQQPDQIATFRAKTDVVLVPVVVRSKKGPVEGLKAEQFTVTEDGKPQTVASLEFIKTGGKVERKHPAGEFSNELTASNPARLTIIAIDTINTPFLDQSFARNQVLKYVANSMEPNEQIAVLSMNRDGSVKLLHDITTDSAMLAKAIKGMTATAPGEVTDTKTTPRYSTVELQTMIMGNNQNAGTGDPGLALATQEAQAFQVFKESTGSEGAYELRRNMEATLSSMRQITEAFAGAPGRKTFVWITGSFPFDITSSAELTSPKNYTYGITGQDSSAYIARNSVSGALPPLPESKIAINDEDMGPMRQEFRTLLQQLAAANIVLYPVDARGLMTLNSEASDHNFNSILQQYDRERAQTSQTTMETMAAMTGGKTCYNKNEITNCVHDASADSDGYYLLSYSRDKKNNKPGWRRLSVKVDAPGADVRARTGYYYGSDSGDKNARTRAINTAARSSVPFTSVQFSARFLDQSAEGNKKAVNYEIYVPPASVVSVMGPDNRFELEFLAIAATPKDPKTDIVSELVGKNLPPEAFAAIEKQGIAYKNKLKVAPGEYTVHFLVRNTANNVVGSIIAPLTVQ